MIDESDSFTKLRWKRIGLIAIGILLSTGGHYWSAPSLLGSHVVFQCLYFLPIIGAAVWFGWKGGLFAALWSGACYTFYFFTVLHGDRAYASQYAEIALFVFVGIVTGIFSSRERLQRTALDKATRKLSETSRHLEMSIEQVRRADRLAAIGQLAASLAHEIRNPLASMEGAVDILERQPESAAERHEFLGIIKKECLRLNRLLSDLLDFARPRRPQVLSTRTDSILRSVAKLVSTSAERSNITVEIVHSDELPEVHCDPQQLRQVVLNLTLNAIQSMPAGGRVTLSARRQGQHILISVMDEGDGIPEGELGRIFDPFFSTKEGGTGLGLSVAHQIVSQHGGAISVERNESRGMVFTVSLPLQQPEGGSS
jgi:signal transduction histidine kinase